MRSKNLTKTRATRALEMIVADAKNAATHAVEGTGDEIDSIIQGKGGLKKIFKAAQDSVAETQYDEVSENTFDAAMEAAISSMYESDIDAAYERMHKVIMTTSQIVIRAAARKAAHDVYAGMHGKFSIAAKQTPRDLLSAATKAARTRLMRDDAAEAVGNATKSLNEIADATMTNTAMVLMMGVPCHAATAATFGAFIRGAPGHMPLVVHEACMELPDLATKHGELVANLVAGIVEVIADNVGRRRKYESILREAERQASDSAAEQMRLTVVESTVSSIYTILIAGAYLTSNRSFFEAGYENSLAEACKVNQKMREQLSAQDGVAVEGDEQAAEEMMQKMYLDLSAMLMSMTYNEDEMEHIKTFVNFRAIDYKEAATSHKLEYLIALYKMAYEEAHAAIS